MAMDIGIEAITGLIGEGAIFIMADTMVDTGAIISPIMELLVIALFL